MAKKIVWVPKAHLNYDYFSLSTVAEVYKNELKKIVGFIFDYKYENLDIFYNQENIKGHAKILINNKKLIEEQINFIKEKIRNFLDKSREHGNKKDLKAFLKWYQSYRDFIPAIGIVFGIELALEKILKNFLSEDDFYKIAFSKETKILQEQKSVLKLAGLKNNQNKFKKRFNNHLSRFAFVGNKMMNYSPLTKEQVIKRINNVQQNWKEGLREIKNNRRNTQREAEKVMKMLNSKQKKLVKLYQEILFLRTERALAVCKAAQLTYLLFLWLCEKLNYNRPDLLKFSKKEIIKMLKFKKRVDPSGRKKYYATFINGKFRVFWGSIGPREEKISNVKEINGTIACKGLARGRVKIIRDVPDVKKVEKGDILVAPYTNPNMIIAMEKAAAFVTNIGGMTSHAAIVSRELNKPCIIGTKIATKVLKDGDLVEVDANKGTVKVIKRYE